MKDIISNPWAVTAAIAGLVGVVTFILYGLWTWQKHLIKTGNHPALQEVLAQVITQIYRFNEGVMDVTTTRLHGVDKERLASVTYNIVHQLLPTEYRLPGIPISFPLKAWFERFVGREVWEAYVKERWLKLMQGWTHFRELHREELKPPEGDVSMGPAPPVVDDTYRILPVEPEPDDLPPAAHRHPPE